MRPERAHFFDLCTIWIRKRIANGCWNGGGQASRKKRLVEEVERIFSACRK